MLYISVTLYLCSIYFSMLETFILNLNYVNKTFFTISLGQQNMSDEDSTDEDFELVDKRSGQGDSDTDYSSAMEEEGTPPEDNFDKEADIAKKVLNNLLTSSSKGTSANNDSMLIKENKESRSDEIVKDADEKASNESEKVSGVSKPEISSRNNLLNPKGTEDDLQRTVFISNLPFECDNEEVKQRFSGFGEIEYFVPVLHQVTKYVLECYFLCLYFTGHYS